jgi:hypothetical protein
MNCFGVELGLLDDCQPITARYSCGVERIAITTETEMFPVADKSGV